MEKSQGEGKLTLGGGNSHRVRGMSYGRMSGNMHEGVRGNSRKVRVGGDGSPQPCDLYR